MPMNPIKALGKSVVAAIVATVLFFFVGNLLGIIGLAIYRAAAHARPDFALAYRAVGAPLGITAGVVAFIAVWVYEFRTHRP